MKHSAHRLTRVAASFVVTVIMSISRPESCPAADVAVPIPHLTGQTDAHDPSTIFKENGQYHLFSTGRIIRRLSSPDLVHWTNGPSVFASPPAWTTNAVPEYRGHTWAPDVIRVGDRYLLYYSVSSFGKQVSAIGLAISPTLDPAAPGHEWTDHGPVIQSQVGDPYNAIDPGVLRDEEGRLWMAFGSFWRGLYLIELDPATGKRRVPETPPVRLAYHEEIEAPTLMRRDGFYYLFVNWGRCCRGTNSTYEIRVGRSPTITGPYLDRDGVDLVQRGGTLFLETEGPFIGPGHVALVDGKPGNWFGYHYYDARRRGRSHLAIGRMEWTADGWPVARVVPEDTPLPEVPEEPPRARPADGS
jgi:arabinan endo-1,5-alpha-L-arabinosidase